MAEDSLSDAYGRVLPQGGEAMRKEADGFKANPDRPSGQRGRIEAASIDSPTDELVRLAAELGQDPALNSSLAG